jgi:hypothetical protein
MDEKYKIRPLTRKDRVTVTAMIVKLANKLGDTGVFNLIKQGSAGTAAQEAGPSTVALDIGIQILKNLIMHLEDDVTAWFASLLNMTPDQFNECPLDVELSIIEQLKAAPEINDFFSKASLLYSGIGQFKNALSTEKKPSDSTAV